ncbi:hypothetical protein SNE40_008358 [Patella caerulea]|uniref:Fibrinogen C-terminal domain-containing protein n=1 Tax=Patella caerulea TaxID=87958 RepID=A0AAN8K6I7_PATCE
MGGVRSELECSILCGRNYDCRKFLYCGSPGGDKWCTLFQDGEDCALENLVNGTCSCYRKGKQFVDGKCISPIGYYGEDCASIIKDCSDGKAKSMNGSSLSYIKPLESAKPFEVLCFFDKSFTTIQRRRPEFNAVDFNRSWTDYIQGFGYMHSEHWIGFQHIQEILGTGGTYRLIIMVEFLNSDKCALIYNDFNITTDFGFTGSFMDYSQSCLENQTYVPNPVSVPFSTFDNGSNKACARELGGGWWYDVAEPFCTNENLNGVHYYPGGNPNIERTKLTTSAKFVLMYLTRMP